MEKLKEKNGMIGGLAIVIAASLWGLDGIVLTPRLYNLDTKFVVFMLHLLPFIGMNFIFYKEYKTLKTFTKSDFIFMTLISLFGGVIGTLSIVKALFLMNFQHLTVVTLLQKLQPIFAIILAKFILKEKISKKFIPWAILALIGGYFLTFEFSNPFAANHENVLEASAYAMLAAFSFGSSTVFGKKMVSKITFKQTLFFRYGFTAVIMFLINLFSNNFGEFSKITTLNWQIFVIIGVTSGSGAAFIYYFGLRHVKASVATICELAFPISSVVFDYIFNGSILSPVQLVSIGIMIFAILKITKIKEEE
ncbi:MAG: EamA/RhaT family transporter [Fusobacteria bacterium]|nr:MAG: EamA/RhaT family transporter [Fusobacteriota bacterium]